MEVSSNILSSFIENNGLYSLIKSPTCFKSSTNPRCIDLMLSNMKHSFFASQSVETGFSDCHHLIYTVLKTQFTKLQPKRIRFRDYKKFSESQFLSDLTGEVLATNPEDLTEFENVFVETLNKHAPHKTVRVRGNNKPHVTKELRKAMMMRTRLKKIANKSGSEYDIKRYRVQRNLVVKMNKDAKRTYYSKLNPTEAGKEKTFWKTFKPLFSSTCTATDKIILVENEAILSDDKEVAECFNSYFANIVETLNIPPEVIEEYERSPDPVVDAINKYASHPSIKKIKDIHGTHEKFEFSNVDPTQVFSEIYRLDKSKKTSGDIPVDMLKLAANHCYKEITHLINNGIKNSTFPSNLKLADLSPCFKTGDSTTKKNFRPLSVLSCLSKIYERLMYTQMLSFVKNKLSDLLCGFREKYSTQHALIKLVEACRKCLDGKGIMGIVLMDLSKAYDCLPHDLLIAKLAAYGFGTGSLNLLHSYLSYRKQRVKIGSTFSDWHYISSGVPQGSILGPLLFNIYINDLLLCIEKSGICNFADDNTLYASGENIGDVATCLEVDIENVLKWFDWNQMVANPEKFQVMFLGLPKSANICIEIDDLVLVPKDNVKLLGITIDSELKFTDHVKSLCTKTSRKVTAFSRVAKLLDFKKARLLYNAFIMSSLSYCPLIWMFCGKTANKEINRIHKRALRILFNDYEASFEELLQRNNEQTVHTKNLHKLMTEVYKSLNCQNPAFMWDLFIRKEVTYDLRAKDLLQLPKARTVLNGLNSIVFRGSILWNAISDEIKSSQSIASFKLKIKSWNGDDCNCNICN